MNNLLVFLSISLKRLTHWIIIYCLKSYIIMEYGAKHGIGLIAIFVTGSNVSVWMGLCLITSLLLTEFHRDLSILGPLLFILYINDIVNCSKYLLFILFADETNLFFSCKDITHLFNTVNSELDKLSIWFKANKLSLNIKKTNYILFGTKHLSAAVFHNVSIDGQLLERVEYTKFLGVYIDEKLTWKKHIEHVASKISKGLGAMGRIRNIVPSKSLLMLYHALVYPYLTYCNIVWGTACASVLAKLVSL